jgi:hypothetical protein
MVKQHQRAVRPSWPLKHHFAPPQPPPSPPCIDNSRKHNTSLVGSLDLLVEQEDNPSKCATPGSMHRPESPPLPLDARGQQHHHDTKHHTLPQYRQLTLDSALEQSITLNHQLNAQDPALAVALEMGAQDETSSTSTSRTSTDTESHTIPPGLF